MRLYLLRHAMAVPRGTPGYSHDSRRPLTEEGHRQARAAAEALKRLKVNLEAIRTSPYLRASQTAEQVARVFGLREALEERDELLPETDPHQASQALRGLSLQEHVLLVGHEPHLSRWLALLVVGAGGLNVLIKKGGLVCVEVAHLPPSPGSGTLRWLLSAKHLSLIAERE